MYYYKCNILLGGHFLMIDNINEKIKNMINIVYLNKRFKIIYNLSFIQINNIY